MPKTDYAVEAYAAEVASVTVALDTLVPGWFHLIDTEELRMVDPFNCIVGQLSGQDPNGLFYGSRLTPAYDELMTKLENLAEGDTQLVLANFREDWVRIIEEKKRGE
jgi:hypothetical protein